MMYGGGWWRYLSYDEEQDRPQLSWVLLKRVWGYARPYQYKTAGLLVTIFIITGLSLIPPLLYRDLIDNALPYQDLTRLNWLALGMIGIPIINALIGMVQRLQYTELADGVWFPMGSMYRLEVVYPFFPSLVYIDRAGTQFVA